MYSNVWSPPFNPNAKPRDASCPDFVFQNIRRCLSREVGAQGSTSVSMLWHGGKLWCSLKLCKMLEET